MSIKLSNNEHMIKNWEYAKGKGSKGKYEASLMVTSKRVISLVATKRAVDYTEIPLEYVKSIDCTQYHKSNVLPILGIIIGIPLSIVIVGIFLIVHCAKLLNQGDFSLTINTRGEEGTSLSVGAYKDKGKGFFGRWVAWLKGKNKIKIDFNTANDICETIGAIILDNKAA